MASPAKAASSDSAAQPAKEHLSLDLLNKASVNTGATWEVCVMRVIEDKYEYMWHGKSRQGSNLFCILVSPTDPRQYCTGQYKKTKQNESKYQTLFTQLKKGGRFVMSKVVFHQDVKEKYISTPIKLVVDLSKTKLEAILGSAESAVQPSPTATVAGSNNLGSNQFFDLTALVREILEIRLHENNRSSFKILILDGSLDNDTKKVKALPLTLFFDTMPSSPGSAEQPPGVEGMKAFLQEQLDNNGAVSFFCISGSQGDDGKFSFRTTKNTIIALAVGTKAEKLNNDAVLHNLKAGDTVAFELQTAGTARDWSIEHAMLTRCKILSTFAKTSTGVRDLDGAETIWQLNCAQISEPTEGQTIRSNDGARLWLPLTVRDDSGLIVLYITEQAVLKLANVVDAAEFEQLHLEGRLRFPFFCSVKIWRKPSKPSAAQPGPSAPGPAQSDPTTVQQNSNDFDCFIVDAAEQDMKEGMSIHSNLLLTMLGDSTDSVLPGMLEMIRKSEHYSLAVQYITQKVPPELTKACSKVEANLPMLRACSKVIVLIQSSKRSKVHGAGANGHKLVTDDVVDFISAGQSSVQNKYSLTSFCTLDNVTDFKLDPSGRAKTQAALINVTGVLEHDGDSAEQPVKSLLVDNVQLLSPEEALLYQERLKEMLYFAALGGQISRKKEREPWSPEVNPGKARKCKSLGRSPSGPALPDYASSS